MKRNIAHHSMRWVFIAIFISLVFIAFFTGFARVSLPFVSTYRAEIQSYVSTFLGKAVEIGALDVSWQKFGPRLVLHDVVLNSGADSSQNVDLKKIYLDLDLFRSWMNGAWQINEVSIVGAKLSFDYYGNQKIRVYGENIDGTKSRFQPKTELSSNTSDDDLDVLRWLLQADRVGLLESSVTLRHRKKDFSVEVHNLNVRVNNQDGIHKIRVDLLVPALSQNTVALNLDFTGEREDLANSVGAFNFSMNDMDLGKATELLSDYLPLSVEGRSDLSLWGKWSKGEVNSLRIQTALGESEWLSKQTAGKVSLPASYSDWVVSKKFDEYRLALNELKLNEKVTDLQLLLRVRPKEKKHWWLDSQGGFLELSSITPIMSAFVDTTIQTNLTKRLLLTSMKGQLHDWHIQLQGQENSSPRLSMDTRFTDLSMGDKAQLPGFSDVDGRLSMWENSGRVSIADTQLRVNLPKWFNAPFKLSQLQGDFDFRIDQERFVVQSEKVVVASDGVSAKGRVKLQKNSNYDMYIDLEGKVSDMTVVEARRFFPEKIMKPKLLSWFDSAIETGRISDVDLVVKGSSKGFPYANGEGEFRADLNFDNGQVKPIKNWPSINVAAAAMQFRQNGMTVDVSKANIQKNVLSDVKLSISDLKKPVVKLHGRSRGELSHALNFIEKTSLKKALEPLVNSASGSGAIELNLDLVAPLYKQSAAISYEGKVVFKGNQWQSKDLGLAVQNIKGPLYFSDNSLTSKGLSAEIFNTPVTITAHTDKSNPRIFSRINVMGDIAASTVLENYDLPISHWFEGRSAWDLQLELKRGIDPSQTMQVSLLAKSELVGTSVDLPRPYGKAKNKKGQLSANIDLSDTGDGQSWNFVYARHLRARVETLPDAGGLKGLAVRFHEPLPDASNSLDGVSISGRVPELSFDGWVSSIADVISHLGESDERSPIMPVRGEIIADNLLLGQVGSGPAQLAFVTDNEHISTQIESKWLAGDLHYPRQYWLDDRPLKSRLSLLDKQFLDSLATAEGSDSSRIDPRDFPSIELTVDRFVWDEYHVADLKMRSNPVSDGMKTEALGFVHNDLQMSGEAYWRVLDPQNIAVKSQADHRTDIRFSLKSDDVGAGLDGIGILGGFSGGQGQVDVALAWDDAAYAPDLSRITGTIKPALKGGRILAVEPGAAKILGLFALQAMPRRLLLDFNDVTKDGLLYDDIVGDIVISDGVAKTNLMRLNGPIGVVSSTGTTDFVHSTYDQKIVVLPRLTSALPIIGLISAGATAGVGVLVADQLLKGVGVNFDEVGKREYLLTGSWDEPKIRRVHVPLKHLPEPENR